MGGPGSVVAANLAVEDSGLRRKGWTIEILVADHGNKADVASTIARQWFDTQGVDAVADVTNSAAALAVSQIVRDKNKVMLDLGTRRVGPHRQGLHAEHGALDPRHLGLRQRHRQGGGAAGGKTWFFLTADFAFGHALERGHGAHGAGRAAARWSARVRSDPTTPRISPPISLQAQASGAQVIGLANSGGDPSTASSRRPSSASSASKQRLAGLLIYVTDVHAIGLQVAQGLSLVSPFYWDTNDGTRAFSDRFAAQRAGAKPSMVQAGVYASILHYLKAVEALGEAGDGAKVVAAMKAMPTDDPLFGKGTIRADGRKMHPMHLYTVKAPSESRYPWDYYAYKATIPAEVAFRPMSEGSCPLVAKSQ